MFHALIVDDDRGHLAILDDFVRASGLETTAVTTLADARAALSRSAPDVVLLDVNLPDGSGLELLEELADHPTTVTVIITGHGSVDAAIDAMRAGAVDYLTKPIDLDRIRALLETVAQTRSLKIEIGSLRNELRKLGRFGPLIGASAPMQQVFDLIAKAAPTQSTVLIVGETGTGKELVARALHELRRRRRAPFVSINCGSISRTLIESELFGHERGSFTGADRMHQGVFERAHGGTILLDEVTEMPPELQVKLLRVLETRRVRRVGGQEPIEVDVRVIAATNRRPSEAIGEGKLREDLFYRLNVVPIELPPLRARGADVELLVEHFMTQLNNEHGARKKISNAALRPLRDHGWPGNVRELRNVLERAFIVSGETIGPESLSLSAAMDPERLPVAPGTSLQDMEKHLILATLAHCRENKRKAAKLLGISLKTLYNRLNEYGQGER
jgi:DNA-binding NtrC family response regulator